MDTLKTAIVVVLLLAVLYGVYVILNRTDDESLSADLAWNAVPLEPPQVELGSHEAMPAADPNLVPDLPVPPAWAPPPGQPEEPADFPAATSQPATAEPGAAESIPDDGAHNATSEPPLVPQDPAANAPPLQPVETPLATETPDASVPEQASSLEPPTTDPPTQPDAAQLANSSRGGDFQPLDSPPPSEPESVATDPSPAVSSFSAFDSALESAKLKIAEENWHDALWTLSLFYNSPDLSPAQHEQLLEWLDTLAAKVVYSREHLIDKPHLVVRGESLIDIAEQHQVPWQLLANINGIENPEFLIPGSKVKVVRGPFYADVNLQRNELTLFVNKLYAGRFDISLGSDPAPQAGEYQVKDKQAGRTYYAADGRTVPAGDPANPYGQVWLDLGSNFCIHGSPQSGPTSSGMGCISLSPVDAGDVFGILSLGSKVTIQR